MATTSNNIRVRRVDGGFAYVDCDGNDVCGEVFLEAMPFETGNMYAQAKSRDGLWRFVGRDGSVSDDGYRYIGDFVEGFVVVREVGNMYRILGPHLRRVGDACLRIYNYNPISQTFIALRLDGYCVLNDAGERVSDFYDEIREFRSTTTAVRRDCGWNVMDNEGRVLYAVWLDAEPKPFGDGYSVSIDGRRLYVSRSGDAFGAGGSFAANISSTRYK